MILTPLRKEMLYAPGLEAGAVNDLYRGYSDFKGWAAESQPTEPADFEYLVGRLGRAGPLRILELGFGAGQFLDWAAAAGHSVVGVEILPEMVARVRERGHVVFGDLRAAEGPFDLIVALDVFEHIEQGALIQMLAECRARLVADGRIAARFPNGDSPFSGRYQNGDPTHQKPLSAKALEQLAAQAGLRLEMAINPRPIPRGLGRAMKRRAAYAVRDLVETVLGTVYLGYRTPMDPNVLVLLKI